MLKFVYTITLFVFTFFNGYCIAPKPANKPQFIVKLNAKNLPPKFTKITERFTIVFEALDNNQTIYSAKYSPSNTNENEVYNFLQKQTEIQIVQKNHILKFRSTTPNDSFYNNQWHLGVVQANKAWDIHRSATNRRGDTIVIAVIDDGLHINHPDFKGNIWINYADTTNNGIDDDNNGYIDDHYGWNFNKNNNDISDSTYWKSVHGTKVAGIIGARTNNKIGISGIMWNTKLMVVNIADSSNGFIWESDVIKAYSYILFQRKLYNATNGKKGAFVVAANCSWGNDSEFPQDAPIWCSFYDTLGAVGILTASAATNNNVNIDIVGDLPSLCTSKHLIVVGATTRYDNFGGYGYSDSSVDISAPAQSIFSSYNYVKSNILNGLYGDAATGNSFSTPMVTAAIGILHGYACERVLDSIKINPKSGNLLLRKFLLDGTDEIPALAGKNATSGRLNIKKAMLKMDAYCYNLSVKNEANLNGINIYPNPGNGEIKINALEDILMVDCFDILGKKIDFTLNQKTLILSVNSGIYFIKIKTEKAENTFKYLKY